MNNWFQKNKKVVLMTSLVVGFIGLATGTYFYVKRQYDLLFEYCYKLTSVQVVQFALSNIKMKIGLAVKNNADIDININGYNFKVYVNDKYVCDFKSNVKELLPANQVVQLNSVIAEFNPTQVVNAAFAVSLLSYYLTDKNKINLKIDGYASASHGIFAISNLPMTFEYTLAELLTPSQESGYCKDFNTKYTSNKIKIKF